MIEPPADDAGQHSRTADALDLWWAGERNVTRRTLNADWRDDYEDAVQAAAAHLHRFSTIAELVSTYFDLEDDAWLDALCRRPSGRILNFGDVEDAGGSGGGSLGDFWWNFADGEIQCSPVSARHGASYK